MTTKGEPREASNGKLDLELRRGVLVLAVLSQLRTAQYGYSLRQALAAEGMPFRDAYLEVAHRIQEGTFHPDPSPALGDLGLEATGLALDASAAWLRGKRDLIQRTTVQLFQWGTK